MSRKIVLFTLAITIIYFFVFFVSRLQRAEPTVAPAIPVLVLPNCENLDIPLLLTTNEETLCKSETSLYIRRQGKKIEIKKIGKNDIYFPSSLNLIVFQSESEFVIEKLVEDNTLKELFLLPIKKGITPISLFLNASNNEELIFINTQKDALSPKDIKSIIYRIKIDSEQVAMDYYPSTEMLKVVDSYQGGESLLLRELFPFLLEKYRILEWQSKSVRMISVCSKYDISFNSLSLSTCTSKADVNDEKTIVTETGKLFFNSEASQLLWQPNDINKRQALLSNVNSQHWQLLAKYSTRNGKRVYNCFDFSESLEITLRICIPQL